MLKLEPTFKFEFGMGRIGMAGSGIAATVADASAGKEPRTARGRKTQRALLDAAAAEFGEKGFHEIGRAHV